jgi:hypothetical protein
LANTPGIKARLIANVEALPAMQASGQATYRW